MKRIICLLTALCIVLGSFSFCFATAVDWDSSDSQHLTEIRNTLMSGGAVYNLINAINSNVVLLNSNLVTLMGWLDPSSGGGTQALLNQILNALTYTDTGGLVKSWLADIWQKNSLTQDNTFAVTPNGLGSRPMSWLAFANGQWQLTTVQTDFYTAMMGGLNNLITIETLDHNYTWPIISTNYASVQTPRNWLDLTLNSFTPASITDGIYKWFDSIQQPVARLSYVLASDERIEAQEAGAANEEAVVDNFIDNSGDGSASPSDFGSISDLSAGYKSNFGSNASVSGIFNIFNSNNMGWFSQETANQLDTTTPTRRGSSFDTPLLDQQINDIYDQIGVKHD